MRYGLRTLVIMTAVGPPLLAGAYWIAKWAGADPVVFSLAAGSAALAVWVIGPIAWWHELVRMVCGPEFVPYRPRKTRRRVRVRIQRYVAGST
jgi:hypothetical protein